MKQSGSCLSLAAILALLNGGCATLRRTEVAVAAPPQNYFAPPNAHEQFRRVAVLPMSSGSFPDQYVRRLDAAFLSELSKRGLFEIVPVSRAQMESLFGERQFSSTEVLPADALKRLQESCGVDGVLFPDYHFMVAATRPLGATMESAIKSFRQDPILTLLLRRGGINLLLATYMSIPAEERLIEDIYEPALHCSTTGMIAANVIFGDYEVALQLADRLMRHGISAPPTDAPEILAEA